MGESVVGSEPLADRLGDVRAMISLCNELLSDVGRCSLSAHSAGGEGEMEGEVEREGGWEAEREDRGGGGRL